MKKHTLKVLEFDKILDMLSSKASCDMTREQIARLAPLTDSDEIEHLQSQLHSAVSLLIRRGSPSLSGIRDITASVKRVDMGGTLNAAELLSIAQILKISRELIRFYNTDNPTLNEIVETPHTGDASAKSSLHREQQSLLDVYFCRLAENKVLELEIFDKILSEDEIADNASRALHTIRRNIENTHQKIRQTLNYLIHSSAHQKYLQEAIVTERDGRYVVPVRAEYKNEISGIVHDVSASGATVFIEPNTTVESNNALRELEAREKEEIERILAELSAKVGEFSLELLENKSAIVEIDFLLAKAKLALEMNATMPIINNHGHITLKNARHPMIDAKKVVPINVELGGAVRSLIITGPNTGGKTVTLKTIGLFCLMAAAGLHIPAAERSEICVFEKIFADIGDEQSIEQSLSTFSSHMHNIVSILNEVDHRSLVLFDELGAGTDPLEGAALAISILEYAKSAGALSVATTHYSELKLYALSNDDVQNAGCEFDIATLRPTYHLIIGVPGKSNAFAISQRLGLSDSIIERANQFLSQDAVKFEDVMANIERTRVGAEQDKKKAAEYLRETDEAKKNLESAREKFEREKQQILSNSKREAKRILEEAKRESKEIIANLRAALKHVDKQTASQTISDSQARINEKLQEVSTTVKKTDNSPAPVNLRVGDIVRVVDIDENATILTLPDASGNVQIQAGILKMFTNIENLRVSKEANKTMIPRNRSEKTGAGLNLAPVKSELHLRGETLSDALYLAEQFIDGASVAKLSQVTIIHGKGTGTLKNGIHKMLKGNPHVLSYRLGTYGEGEDGVTIVTLK